MTVRLTRPFNGFDTNDIVTLDKATEAALVSQNAAVDNPTQGITWLPNDPFDIDRLNLGDPIPAESFGVSPTNTAQGNWAAMQAALAVGGYITLNTPGVYDIGETMLIGNRTFFQCADSVFFRHVGSWGKALLRAGNAHWIGDISMPAGISIICASENTRPGVGRIRRDVNTLFYTAPGDTEGAGVPITVGPAASTGTARYTLTSGDGVSLLHVTVSQPSLTGVTGFVQIVSRAPGSGSRSVTWSRTSNITTVTETAHGRQAGDVVVLFGANFVGQVQILEVTGANTYTFSDSRSNASGSGSVFGTRNISVSGGSFDGRFSTNTQTRTVEDRHCLIFVGSSGWSVRSSIRDVQKYGLLGQGCANYSAVVNFFADGATSSTAGVQINGCSFNGYVSVRGTSTDTIVGMIGGDFPNQTHLIPSDEGGCGFVNSVVEDIVAYDTLFELVRWAPHAGAVMRNNVTRRLRGTIDTTSQQKSAVSLIADTGLHTPGDYSVQNFVIDDVQVSKSNGTNHLVAVELRARGTVRSRGVRISNVFVDYPLEAAGQGFVIIGSPSGQNCAFEDVTVSGFGHLTPTWQGFAVITQNTGSIERLRVEDVTLNIDNALRTNTWVSRCFSHATGITIGRCELYNLTMREVSSAGTRSGPWVVDTSGGQVDTLVVQGLRCNDTLDLGYYNSTNANCNIVLMDAEMQASAARFGVRFDRPAASISVGNIRSFGTQLTDLIRIGYSSATMVIRSLGGLYIPTGSGTHVNIATGTANAPNVDGGDLTCVPASMSSVRGSLIRSNAAGNPKVYWNGTAWTEIA